MSRSVTGRAPYLRASCEWARTRRGHRAALLGNAWRSCRSPAGTSKSKVSRAADLAL